MSTLIRTIAAGAVISGTVYPADTVVNCDDYLAAKLIAAGTAVSIESASFDVDDVAASTKKFGCLLALAAAAQTLDLTSLASAGASRDSTSTNFSAIHTIQITNFGTGTNVVTFGNAASNQFVGPFGAAANTYAIPAGTTVTFRTNAAAGWTVDSTHKNIKFDPGSDTFKVGVVLGGIGS